MLRDGALAFDSTTVDRAAAKDYIAIYWAPVSLGQYGRVYYRETEDKNILNLAKSEVQIQYAYGDNFVPRSVLIITWENVAPVGARPDLPIDVSTFLFRSRVFAATEHLSNVVRAVQ